MVAFSGLTEFHEARGGERSPESGCGFQNWDDRIHVGGNGCINLACGIPRHLQKVHVQHTWNAYAGRPSSCGCWAVVPMNCPSRRSIAISQTGRSHRAEPADKLVQCPDRHRDPGPHSWLRTSVRCCPAKADDRSKELASGHATGRHIAGVAGCSDRGGPTRPVPSISDTPLLSSNGQSNTTTPRNPAILVGQKSSQAVCKLRSSSSLIVILKMD